MSVLKTFDIALDTKKALYGSRITLVESDTGNRFVITLTDDGTAVDLTGCRVSVVFSGAMGTAMQESWTGTGDVSISGTSHNIITIDVHSGSFATGLNTCEIQVYSGATYTTLITSARFTFNAQKPILDDETIVSTDSYPTLVYWADKLEALTEREQADWTEADNTKGTYIQHKPVVNVDFAAAAHASRHLIGGADALNAMPYDATSTNLLIDGGFQIWLAGTSFTNPAASSYTATMWKLNAFTADGGTFPTSLVHEKIESPAETTGNIYRITTNGAGSGYGALASYAIRQIIEHGTRRYAGAGKKVTVSFRARSSIAGKKIGIMLYQNYGTGGSPTTQEMINGNNFTLTAAFQTFTHTFTLNTLSGKTFGTAFDDAIRLDFLQIWGASIAAYVGASTAETFGGSGSIDICDVQFNVGSVALPYVVRSFDDELVASMRYYIPKGANVYVTAFSASALTGFRFPVVMRIAPTVTFYDYLGTTANTVSLAGVGTALAVTSSATHAAGVNSISTGTTTAKNIYVAFYEADARM